MQSMKASREEIWLRLVDQHIRGLCRLEALTKDALILYEDNTACITQLQEGYIKGDRTNHISPRFFFTHDLCAKEEINIQQIPSCNNPADLFTKALPTSIFESLIKKMGLSQLRDINGDRHQGE
jgi:hypothetical protein